MGALVVAGFALAFGIVSLYKPRLYRKVLAPLCFLREDDLPPFPRTAAVGLIIFFGLIVLAPAALTTAGRYLNLLQPFFDWLVAIAFLLAGLGVLISPHACARLLKWPQYRGSGSVIIARLVGVLLLVGAALFTKVEILHW
jgi:hypothetical protein